MKFDIDCERDFSVDVTQVRYRGRRIIPTMKVTVTDRGTGEVTEGCDMDVSKRVVVDDTPFVKLYSINLVERLSHPAMKLFCFVMEKTNQWGRVEISVQDAELYEFTGFQCRAQVYKALRELRENGVVMDKKEGDNNSMWYVREGVFSRKYDSRADDRRMFIKLYQPRILMALDKSERAMVYYIFKNVGFDGVVEINNRKYLKAMGYSGWDTNGSHGMCNWVIKIKKRLRDKGLIKDISHIVKEEGDNRPRSGRWYRINPSVFFKGNRIEAGYRTSLNCGLREEDEGSPVAGPEVEVDGVDEGYLIEREEKINDKTIND